MSDDNRPTILDLFSGIGGFSLAFEAEGFRTIGFAEIDPYACRVLKKHWPDVPNLGDITKLCRRAHDCEQRDGYDCYCQLCEQEFGDCDCIGTDQFVDTYGTPCVIAGGFPCQPFSVAGHKRGEADHRHLWPAMLRVIRELYPRFVVGENVTNITNMVLHRCLDDLEECGYRTKALDIPACALGLPTLERHVWIIAEAKSPGCERDGKTKIPDKLRISGELLGGYQGGGNRWPVSSPRVCGVGEGIPNRLDRTRCVGNAFNPQIAQIFARAIRQTLMP